MEVKLPQLELGHSLPLLVLYLAQTMLRLTYLAMIKIKIQIMKEAMKKAVVRRVKVELALLPS